MQNEYSPRPFVNNLMKVEHVLTVIFGWICAGILIALLTTMVCQVFSRFVLKLSVPWTDELSRYLWISITYMGAGAAISENAHVEISLIATIIARAKTDKARRMWARIIDIIRFTLIFILSCFLFRYAWVYMFQVKGINMLSAAMEMPIWWLDAVLTVGVASMAVHSLIRLLIAIVDDNAIVDPVCLGKEAGE